MKTKFLPAAAMAGFLSLSVVAFAADATRKKNALGKLDADKDGKITEAEFVTGMKERMDEAKAINVFAGNSTSLPRSTPIAFKAISMASVPFATATQ